MGKKGTVRPGCLGESSGNCDGEMRIDNVPNAGSKSWGKVTSPARIEVFDLGNCVERRATGPRRRCRRPARVRNQRLGYSKPCRWHEKPDEAQNALRPGVPTFDAAFGGAGLDPFRPPHAAGSVLSHEDRHRGSRAQPFGPSDLGDRSGSSARPFTKNPGLRDGAPRFLGRETLEKPDSATSINALHTQWECLKRPTAKSVHFGSTKVHSVP